MTEKPLSIFEAVFNVKSDLIPEDILNLLDKTLSKDDLDQLLTKNGLKVTKEWTPMVGDKITREILEGYKTYRIRISNNDEDEIADFGVMCGDDEELFNLLIELAEHEVPVYGSSPLERNF